MFRLSFLLALILCGLSLTGRAGDDAVQIAKPEGALLDLDIDRAIALALAKNFQIEAANYLPDIARQRQRAASGDFDPGIEANYNRAEDANRALANQIDATRPLSLVTQRTGGNIGLGGLLPFGTTYNLGLGYDTIRRTDQGFGSTFTAGPEASVTQPLLRGFGFDANLAGVRIARTNRVISQWQLRQTVIDVVTSVIFFYHELRFAVENLAVARRSMALAQQLLEDNSRRAEIGVMSPLDITTARAQVAQRQDAVLLAERNMLDNANFLKQQITNDIEQVLDLQISLSEPDISLNYEVEVPQGIETAFQLRPDYQNALLDLRRRGISLAFTRNQALPRLDLTGSLRLLGAGGNLSSSVGNAAGRDQTSWTAGIVARIPFPNRTGLGNLQAERLENAQALINLKALEQDIVISVDNAAGRIRTARQRVLAAREARRLAYESVDAGNERLKAGTGTTFELLQLQEDLAMAEVSEIRAEADFYRSVAEYERQTGQTLRTRRIEIDPE